MQILLIFFAKVLDKFAKFFTSQNWRRKKILGYKYLLCLCLSHGPSILIAICGMWKFILCKTKNILWSWKIRVHNMFRVFCIVKTRCKTSIIWHLFVICLKVFWISPNQVRKPFWNLTRRMQCMVNSSPFYNLFFLIRKPKD